MRSSHAIGIVAVIASASGVEIAAAQPEKLRAEAEAIVNAAYPADGPGAAVIITRGGRTVYAGGRGLADLDGGRPITPDTVFKYASITKQFTAAMILQLVQEGRISLDDPISRFFPDFPQPGASATVRQLLNHTSGIQNYTSPGVMAEEKMKDPYSTAGMIALFRDRPSPTPPGTAWAYNNSGYIMLGAIIEKVSRKRWYKVLEERITGPLGLSSIGYGADGRSRPAMARGYDNTEGTVTPAKPIHMSVPHAGGALVGTVRDLARWNQALHGGRVVSPQLYRAMTSPAALPEGRTHPYGFGLSLGEIRDRRTVGHGGGIFGFWNYSVYLPSEDLFVAVLSNHAKNPLISPSTVATRLAALALGDPYPEFTRTDVPQQTLAPLFGLYRIGEAGSTRSFYSRGGKLYTMRSGAAEQEVFPAGNDRFFYGPNIFSWFQIERRPDGGHVMAMYLNGNKKAERAVRSGDVPPPFTVDRATLQSYVGRYLTDGPAVVIAMGEGGGLTVQLGKQPTRSIRPVSAAEFLVEGVGARIVFHSEGGAVNRLVVHQGSNQIEARRAH